MRFSALSRFSGILLFPCLVFPSLFLTQTQAQTPEKDSLLTRIAYAHAVKVYHDYLEPENGLIRGSQYVDYAYQLKSGHPFFENDHMSKGSILYDGILYEDLFLLYDLAREQVVINDAFKIYKVFLINERIDRFTIGEHIFIPVRDSLTPSAPEPGFYELLHQGRIALLKKEKKTVQEDLTSGEVRKYIDSTISYYLKKGETYYPVNNKRSLLQALNDRGRELKKFIRKNDLNLRIEKEDALLKIAAWYDPPSEESNKQSGSVNP